MYKNLGIYVLLIISVITGKLCAVQIPEEINIKTTEQNSFEKLFAETLPPELKKDILEFVALPNKKNTSFKGIIAILEPLLFLGTHNNNTQNTDLLAHYAYIIANELVKNKKNYKDLVPLFYAIDKKIATLKQKEKNNTIKTEKNCLTNLINFKQLLIDNLCWRYTLPIKLEQIEESDIDKTSVNFTDFLIHLNGEHCFNTYSKSIPLLKSIKDGFLAFPLTWKLDKILRNSGEAKPPTSWISAFSALATFASVALESGVSFFLFRTLFNKLPIKDRFKAPLSFGCFLAKILTPLMAGLLIKQYNYIHFDTNISKAMLPVMAKVRYYEKIIINNKGFYVGLRHNDNDSELSYYKLTLDKHITLKELFAYIKNSDTYKKQLLSRFGEHRDALQELSVPS